MSVGSTAGSFGQVLSQGVATLPQTPKKGVTFRRNSFARICASHFATGGIKATMNVTEVLKLPQAIGNLTAGASAPARLECERGRRPPKARRLLNAETAKMARSVFSCM